MSSTPQQLVRMRNAVTNYAALYKLRIDIDPTAHDHEEELALLEAQFRAVDDYIAKNPFLKECLDSGAASIEIHNGRLGVRFHEHKTIAKAIDVGPTDLSECGIESGPSLGSVIDSTVAATRLQKRANLTPARKKALADLEAEMALTDGPPTPEQTERHLKILYGTEEEFATAVPRVAKSYTPAPTQIAQFDQPLGDDFPIGF